MNKNWPLGKSIHHAAKGVKILLSGRFEIHRDMYISHAEGSYNTAFICQSVVRRRQREIDHRLKSGLVDSVKLFLGWLPGGAPLHAERLKISNLEEFFH